MSRLITIVLIAAFTACSVKKVTTDDIYSNVEKGNYHVADSLIKLYISQNDISPKIKKQLLFESERMDRIKKDFTKSEKQIRKYLLKYYSENELDTLMERCEKSKALEFKMIDGVKKYFYRADRNMFLIDKLANKRKKQAEGDDNNILRSFNTKNNQALYNLKLNNKELPERKMEITYTLKVKPNKVPAGETIKAWLPFPHEIDNVQYDIKLLSASENNYKISSNKSKHRSVFMTAKAKKDSAKIFKIKYLITTKARVNIIKDSKDLKISEDLKEFVQERHPHIVFSDRIKELSKKLVNDDDLPYEKAQKIFTWIDKNIPWAGAREYSTIRHIPEYSLENMHGDCGIVSLLFITMCRYNGIPAKWESGWMLHPGDVGLHDWSEIYLEPYGWIPVDQSFGLSNFDNPALRYFYLGSMDGYRLIVNEDYSHEFEPKKQHFRSETVDFQRGEVEWKGGNLFFDEWRYKMDVKYLN